ncbi:lactonase family protein [Micrococcus sp. IITD107]|uniref:lactonase family protein n=1 Tax=Micrococcus sp. IITD107 TaxID=3342790 RepID=UPI0035BA460C
MATGSLLVGTFNDPGSDLGAPPSSHGLVTTTGWPTAPEVTHGSGPDAPSWLVRGRPGTRTEGRLYAALHVEEGALAVLEPGEDPGAWTTVQQVPTQGSSTCHADLNPSATWLAAASYDSATLTVVPVHDDGRLGEAIAVTAPEGAGPIEGRQGEPHLHFVLFLDDDRLLVTDLGADRILEYSMQALTQGQTEPRQTHRLPGGTGPRHIAVLACPHDPDSVRLAVVGELDSRIHVMDVPAGDPGPEGFQGVAITPTHLPDADPDSIQENLPSHLVLSEDGSLLYVANRGRDTIGVIRVAEIPELIAEVPCGGSWPRHIGLVSTPAGQALAVALERDDAVVLLPLGENGTPQAPSGQVTVRRPGFVLPL